MRVSKSNRGKIIKSHLLCAENNRRDAAIAPALSTPCLINPKADTAKRRENFGFWFWPRLARFMQKTDRSVSYPQGEKTMTAVAQKTVLTGCLAPIDKNGLEQLIVNSKANPKVIKTLKCKTVAEGKFRHANYIRNLAPYIVDEPPGLLGDDTAPNPSEASLAALGSCLAVGLHANAVHRGWTVNKLELELEGDLNITAVWGTGDVSEKPVGFTDVRVKVDMQCEGVPQSEIDALVTHVKKWSPVANTFTRPVNLEVSA
jgi:uncharacterized OsmC-like protein